MERPCHAALLAACLSLPITALSEAARAASFTLVDPAANSQAITVENTKTSDIHTIVPRLTGPEPPAEPGLHDGQTGARTEEFGTAYSYANPLYGTTRSAGNEVGGQQGGGPDTQPEMLRFVVARFGAPPDKLPPIPGVDLATYQPPVPLIRYALDAPPIFPDPAASVVIERALHSMGRAAITQIDIKTDIPAADRARRAALLRQVALAFLHIGVHPAAILSQGRRLLPHLAGERGTALPGHVIALRLSEPCDAVSGPASGHNDVQQDGGECARRGG